MFSFRTTGIEDQLDKALTRGLVGVFCTPNSWDTAKGRYLYELFRERGNLGKVFEPAEPELGPKASSIEFSTEELEGLQAIVVEIQDVGSRYFGYTKDVIRLMDELAGMESPPSLYIVDHVNPAGRVVEGSMPAGPVEAGVPKVAHRHGLTLGELCHLYLNELGAKFPLHVISAGATDSNRLLMPWTIAPAPDIPGLFTCDLYSGGGLWNQTNLTPGLGTARPYEYIGAPFLRLESIAAPPAPAGVQMRPCAFVPASGLYAGEKCWGWQIILEPGTEYHSLIHTLQIARHLKSHCSAFELSSGFASLLADPVILDYVLGEVSGEEMREHVKLEEQKWIRKAKKFVLYEEQPYRIK